MFEKVKAEYKLQKAQRENQQPEARPLYQTNGLTSWSKVYPNRIELKHGVGVKSIPIAQVASVGLARMGVNMVTIETTGGKRYKVNTRHKKELRDAIYQAQAMVTTPAAAPQGSTADELLKLAELKKQGALTSQEFEAQKKRLIG